MAIDRKCTPPEKSMPDTINHERRRFVGAAAVTIRQSSTFVGQQVPVPGGTRGPAATVSR
jgi:hypothetical protein